ncbi:MAG: helix-turn-helix domain-containing protein [Oscillospiraceae bacterium]
MEKKICYKKLFKLMIDRDLKGHDLREKVGISQSTYFKLQHDQPKLSTQMLVRICCALDCQLWDIADLVDKTDDV